MKVLNQLILNKKNNPHAILFGIPTTEEELKEMFESRFNIYKNKNYIEPEKLKENLDLDDYDKQNKCTYFIAKINEKIIGSARVIKDYPLPTQLYFEFEEPQKMKEVPNELKVEISRLVVAPYKINNLTYLPRHIVMLMLFETMAKYAKEKNYKAGYAFIKSKLFYKLKNLKVPFYLIENYKQRYPEDGILYKYFNNPDDPVLPIYYFLEDIERYFNKLFSFKLLFTKKENEIIMKNLVIYNLLLKFLRLFK